MSNQHNEQAFEKIMQEVEQLDRENMIEDDLLKTLSFKSLNTSL